MDLSRSARAKAAISAGRLAFPCERGQKIRLEVRRDRFISELFNGEPDLFVVERLRGGEMLDELFEHAMILG